MASDANRGFMKDSHIHTPNDGRGIRAIFCNGVRLERCFFADTKKGFADCYVFPYKRHKYRNIAISRRKRGIIRVEYV